MSNIGAWFKTTTKMDLNDISIGDFEVYRDFGDPRPLYYPWDVTCQVSFTIYTALP